MSNHVLRLSTLASAMLAATAATAGPKPFDEELVAPFPSDEEVVLSYIASCSPVTTPGLRLCQEAPLRMTAGGRIENTGPIDMFVGVNQPTTKRFYRGRTDGLFNPPEYFGMDAPTSGLKLADFDGDGDLEMIETVRADGTADSGFNVVYVNRNGTMDSFFKDEQPLDQGSILKHDRSSSVSIGDVNNDGKLDVLVTNETPGPQNNPLGENLPHVKTNYLYLNQTPAGAVDNIVFGPAIALDTAAEEAYTRRGLLIDVEGDGDLDFVVTSAKNHHDDTGNGNFLYENRTANGGSGNANGNPFRAAVPLNANTADDTDVANAIAAGDLNGDGKPDLVFSTWSRMSGASAVKATNRYYINNSTAGTINFETTGTFGSPAHHTNVRLGDFDKDGDLDLLAVAFEGRDDDDNGRPPDKNRLYRNIANTTPGSIFDGGTALAEPEPPAAGRSRAVDTADINGDSWPDLVILNRDQRGLRYLNNAQCTTPTCGGYNGPFENFTPNITGQSSMVIPAGNAPIDVNELLDALVVTDPDNVFPTDFTALVADGGSWYTCTDGVVPSGATMGTCENGRITPTSSLSTGDTRLIDLKVRDGEDSSGSVIATLTVAAGSRPQFTTSTLPGATEDANYAAFTIPASDNDGQSLTFEAEQPLPSWLALSPAGVLSSTSPPRQGDVGSHPIVVRVTDSTGLYAIGRFNLTVANVNDKPTVVTSALPNGVQGQAYPSTTVTGTDEDPNTTLTFSASGLPSGLTINPTTGAITGTPTQSGTFPEVDLTVNDGTLASDPKRVSITIAPPGGTPPPANRAPTFTAPGPQSGTVGTAYNLSLAGSAADADGDTLSFAATGLPPGITLSTAGALSGTPTTATGSPFTVNVTVSDGKGGQATGSFPFTVVTPTSGGNNAGGGDSGGGGGSFGLFEVLSLLGLGALAGRRRRVARDGYARR